MEVWGLCEELKHITANIIDVDSLAQHANNLKQIDEQYRHMKQFEEEYRKLKQKIHKINNEQSKTPTIHRVLERDSYGNMQVVDKV